MLLGFTEVLYINTLCRLRTHGRWDWVRHVSWPSSLSFIVPGYNLVRLAKRHVQHFLWYRR